MPDQLPTYAGQTTVTKALLDSLCNSLQTDNASGTLRMFAYAVSQKGWAAIAAAIRAWKSGHGGRQVEAYVGTDHALTEPEALRKMRDAGVQVHVMVRYTGIYHPKVFWLSSPERNLLWVGSNNLTRDGLVNNFEFATLTEFQRPPEPLAEWQREVARSSDPLTDILLGNYETERQAFLLARAEAFERVNKKDLGTFGWSRRATARRPTAAEARPVVLAATGDLIIEITPKETADAGNQVQIPIRAAEAFFGLPEEIGGSIVVRLRPPGDTPRDLTMTKFGNSTTRLTINELDLRDRPCLMVFHKAGHEFEFEIVKRSVFPSRYAALLALCTNQSRTGSRWWGFA